jgi:hypothetical protein
MGTARMRHLCSKIWMQAGIVNTIISVTLCLASQAYAEASLWVRTAATTLSVMWGLHVVGSGCGPSWLSAELMLRMGISAMETLTVISVSSAVTWLVLMLIVEPRSAWICGRQTMAYSSGGTASRETRIITLESLSTATMGTQQQRLPYSMGDTARLAGLTTMMQPTQLCASTITILSLMM